MESNDKRNLFGFFGKRANKPKVAATVKPRHHSGDADPKAGLSTSLGSLDAELAGHAKSASMKAKLLAAIRFRRGGSGADAGQSVFMDFSKRPKPIPIIGRLKLRHQYALILSVASVAIALAWSSIVVRAAMQERANALQEAVNVSTLQARKLQGEVQAAAAGSSPSFLAASQTMYEFMNSVAVMRPFAKLNKGRDIMLPPVDVKPVWIDSYWNLSDHVDLTDVTERGIALTEALDVALVREPMFGGYTAASTAMRDAVLDLGELARSTGNNGFIGVASDVERVVNDYVVSGTDELDRATVSAKMRALSASLASLGVKGKALDDSQKIIEADLVGLIGAVQAARSEVNDKAGTAVGFSSDVVSDYIRHAQATVVAPKTIQISILVTQVASGIAAVSLLLSFIAGSRAAAIAAWESAQSSADAAELARREKDDVDKSVIQLMNAMRPAQRGDLTHRIPVTEDVIGTVADKFNAVTESLGETIGEVKVGTLAAQQSIGEIAKQASATKDVTEVAFNTSRAAKQASERGVNAVEAAVNKAQRQREHMQEVSKAIKHVGETAQSITAVTDLIEHASERVRIMAMNTSLQAAAAGEEGTFFRVLADELGKMADETNASLKKIAGQVTSMQGETQSVIKNVEDMTADVVASSKLWSDAKEALGDIGQFTAKMDGLVESIAATATVQAKAAVETQDVMHRLSESAERFVTEASA